MPVLVHQHTKFYGALTLSQSGLWLNVYGQNRAQKLSSRDLVKIWPKMATRHWFVRSGLRSLNVFKNYRNRQHTLLCHLGTFSSFCTHKKPNGRIFIYARWKIYSQGSRPTIQIFGMEDNVTRGRFHPHIPTVNDIKTDEKAKLTNSKQKSTRCVHKTS